MAISVTVGRPMWIIWTITMIKLQHGKCPLNIFTYFSKSKENHRKIPVKETIQESKFELLGKKQQCYLSATAILVEK